MNTKLTNWGLLRYLLGEVPPSGAGDFYPQGARRIRKAAKPLTAAQALGPKVTKGPPKPKVSDFLYANLAAKEMAFKH